MAPIFLYVLLGLFVGIVSGVIRIDVSNNCAHVGIELLNTLPTETPI